MASTTKRFEGKSVIITGSSTGMGAGFAKAFAAEGAKVTLTGRNVDKLKNVAEECKKTGAEVIYTAGDLTSAEVRKRIVDGTLSAFGKIDILINNAGMGRERKTIVDDIEELFEHVIDVNLRSVYHLTSLVAPHIVKTKGNIINISSVAAMRPIIGASPYCIAKCGLDMMTRCLAAELAPHGVRVNGINPGSFRTEFLRDRIPELEKRKEWYSSVAKTLGIGRVGEVEDIIEPVLFLASEQASFITGGLSVVDGGWLLSSQH